MRFFPSHDYFHHNITTSNQPNIDGATVIMDVCVFMGALATLGCCALVLIKRFYDEPEAPEPFDIEALLDQVESYYQSPPFTNAAA